MWAQYLKRLPVTQAVILAACAALRFYYHAKWSGVAACFVAMQIGALIGAAWAASLTRRIQASRDRLPLDKR